MCVRVCDIAPKVMPSFVTSKDKSDMKTYIYIYIYIYLYN